MATSALRNTSKRRQWSNRDKAFRDDQNTRRRNNCARRLFRLMAGGVTAPPFTGVNRAARRADAKFLAELEAATPLADVEVAEGLVFETFDPEKESFDSFIQRND